MNIKAILFDMDGTLGDTMPVVYIALQETFRRYAGRDYTPAEIVTMFGPTEEGVIRPRVPEADGDAAVQMYLDRYAALHGREPFPGIYRLLDLLGAKGIRRGVVTGKGPGTNAISMRAMGLDPYFEAVVTGSDNGAEKDQAIGKVLDAWGIAPAQAAYVGDMPYDMYAARQAGVMPLGAAWAQSTHITEGDGAAKVFYSVEEMIDWVEEEG